MERKPPATDGGKPLSEKEQKEQWNFVDAYDEWNKTNGKRSRVGKNQKSAYLARAVGKALIKAVN